MKIYDISQDLFKCSVYPGDPLPTLFRIRDIADGDLYNLTQVGLCTHTGAHIDAPAHFIRDGKTIADLPVELFIGKCDVIEVHGDITGDFIERRVSQSCTRLIFKTNGEFHLDKSGANALINTNVRLVGIDSLSIALEHDEMATHTALLNNDIIILEGLVLDDITPGRYTLYAPPLNLGPCEAAPCRAVLIDDRDDFDLLPVFGR